MFWVRSSLASAGKDNIPLGMKLHLIQALMQLNFSLWQPNTKNKLPDWRLECFIITLPRDMVSWNICKDTSAADLLVKVVSKIHHVHLDQWLDAILDLSELEHCISSILVSTLWRVNDLFPNLIVEGLSRTLEKKALFAFKNGNQLILNWLPLWKFQEPSGYQKKKNSCPVPVMIYCSWDVSSYTYNSDVWQQTLLVLLLIPLQFNICIFL